MALHDPIPIAISVEAFGSTHPLGVVQAPRRVYVFDEGDAFGPDIATAATAVWFHLPDGQRARFIRDDSESELPPFP